MTDSAVVVITGASSGIGRTTAQLYAEHDAIIVNADMQEEPRDGGAPTHTMIEDAGGTASFIETDVRDWQSVSTMIEDVVETYGRIDVLVNNAGVAENGPIDEYRLKMRTPSSVSTLMVSTTG